METLQSSSPSQPSSPSSTPTESQDLPAPARQSPGESVTASDSPSSEKLPRGLVAHRTFNHTIIAVGKKGSGKSEWCLRQCLRFAQIPCYIVVHDAGWKNDKGTLHDGTPTHVKLHGSAKEARQVIVQDPAGIHLISSPSADEVVALAKDLASASLEANGGDKGHPVILYLDEAVSAEIVDPNYIDPAFKKLLAEARHEHVGIIIGCQSARWFNNQVLSQASHVQLFQITDERDHRRLIECGISKDIVMHTRHLGVGESITVRL